MDKNCELKKEAREELTLPFIFNNIKEENVRTGQIINSITIKLHQIKSFRFDEEHKNDVKEGISFTEAISIEIANMRDNNNKLVRLLDHLETII